MVELIQPLSERNECLAELFALSANDQIFGRGQHRRRAKSERRIVGLSGIQPVAVGFGLVSPRSGRDTGEGQSGIQLGDQKSSAGAHALIVPARRQSTSANNRKAAWATRNLPWDKNRPGDPIARYRLGSYSFSNTNSALFANSCSLR